jgi:hypothetical protein
LGGDLFSADGHLTYVTKRFRIYALATTPTWTDTFKEAAASGIGAYQQTGPGPGSTIILSTGQTSGSVTSIPITPTVGAASWSTLHVGLEASAGTTLTVDLLDLNGNVVLANLSDGADLSGLSLATYPSLKLRANFKATVSGQTPKLHYWGLSWQPLTFQPPLLTAITPVSVTNNLSTTLIVSGSSFLTDSQIILGALPGFPIETTFVSSQTLHGQLSSGLSPGLYDLSVQNPDGQIATLTQALTVMSSTTALLPPQITAISPISATNDLTTTLTVSGSNFVAGAQARLGASYTLPTTFISPNVLTATLSPGRPSGSYTVTVTNPDGQSATLSNGFALAQPQEDYYSVYLPVVIK